MSRRVDCESLFTWLPSVPLDGAVVTSLPDANELDIADPESGEYRDWFSAAATACFEKAAGRPVVFLQTDRLHAGRWTSKAGLILDHAHALGAPLRWHKIALRREPGKVDLHRPGYTHVLAFGGHRPGRRTPDVIPPSPKTWPNGAPIGAARAVASWLADLGETQVLNPACGHGTFLAVAEAAGMDAAGCDIEAELVEIACALTLTTTHPTSERNPR